MDRFERPLTIRLTKELNAHVTTLAQSRGISNACAVRTMLADHLGLPSEPEPVNARDRWLAALRPLVLGFECLTAQDVNTLLNSTREYSLGKDTWRRKHLAQALQALGFRQQTLIDGQVRRKIFVRENVRDPLQAYLERKTAEILPHKTRPVVGRPGTLSESEVIEIRRLCAEGQLTKKEIGARFGTSSTNIRTIATGKTYKYVTAVTITANARHESQAAAIRGYLNRVGHRSEPRQLGEYCSAADIADIHEMAAMGIPQASLARHYAVVPQTIRRFIQCPALERRHV